MGNHDVETAMLMYVPWAILTGAVLCLAILCGFFFWGSDRERPVMRIASVALFGMAVACVIVGSALFVWPHLWIEDPTQDGSRFEYVELIGDVKTDRDRLTRLDRSFEFVTAIDNENGQKTLIFRKGQFSYFQQLLATSNARGFLLTVVSLLLSLVGIAALYGTVVSLRASVTAQAYQRYQNVVQTLLEHPNVYRQFVSPTDSAPPRDSGTPPADAAPAAADLDSRMRLIRSSLLSMFEELYLLRHSDLFPPMPERAWTFWNSFLAVALEKYELLEQIGEGTSNYDPQFLRYCRDLLEERGRPATGNQ